MPYQRRNSSTSAHSIGEVSTVATPSRMASSSRSAYAGRNLDPVVVQLAPGPQLDAVAEQQVAVHAQAHGIAGPASTEP